MLLKVSKLSVAYADQTIVQDFDLSLDEGKVAAIVGESGSGKTTVIRAILGCLPHEGHITGGEIFFDGKNLLENTPEDWRKLCGTQAAMIFQDSGSMMDPIQRIGSQFIEYICEHSSMSKKEAAAAAEEMLKKLHLPHTKNVMNSYPFELSGGMRQRVGIAMAMFFKPRLLLADEPTSALDVTTQAQVVTEMLEICRNDRTAMMIVTHNIGVAAYMSEQLIVMRAGRIVEAGKTSDIIMNPQSAYTKELLESVPQIGGKRYVI
ncbi:ABC transporter ATP-binding protein [Anaerosinus massiliensis]|uniref:ABC transporter ATP-binding protein n=1 Tax=Massilibacillus massiliensis TaxID=1806837 RepID=UPI000A3F3FE4|nr:ABC transporter ATP-binding protein [Massilibacillus massiliensis]